MFITNENNIYVKAINDVIERLIAAQVPFTVNPAFKGLQLRFPWHHGDVACHARTYNSDQGLVESYQFPWDDDDVTVATPKLMADLIIDLYSEN